MKEHNSHSYSHTSGWKNSEADMNSYHRVNLCSPSIPEQSCSTEIKEMQDHIYSHCKHIHSIASIWYNKTQDLVATPKLLLYLCSKTTPAMYSRNTALSVEVIYDYNFHKKHPGLPENSSSNTDLQTLDDTHTKNNLQQKRIGS